MEELETVDELLREYRASETDTSHTTVLLVGNLDAMRVVAMWSIIPVVWTHPGGSPPRDAETRWDWIWEGCKFDERELIRRSIITKQSFERLWEPLRASRIIYPDGTITAIAKQLIRTTIGEAAKRGMR